MHYNFYNTNFHFPNHDINFYQQLVHKHMIFLKMFLHIHIPNDYQYIFHVLTTKNNLVY